MSTLAAGHEGLIRRGKRLEYFTVAYNSLEGIVSIAAGAMAGSIALVGFGVDSVIEVSSGAFLLWRLHAGEKAEQLALRLVGASLLALAAYVTYESVGLLIHREQPERSLPGIVIAAVSLIVMPWLAHAKRKVAAGINSAALRADARQTDFCMYLSAILLAGLSLHALFGWWWADPAAALIMVPIIAKEGWEAVRGHSCGCGDACHSG
jgi:divalent metal cation (Fe/Co/Zn/Cd) transporter